jgi:hypothetical protein
VGASHFYRSLPRIIAVDFLDDFLGVRAEIRLGIWQQ